MTKRYISFIAHHLSIEKLKILSLGRNAIKKISGLDELAGTLEELWMSYNQVEKITGLNMLKKLRVLYLAQNNIKSFDELLKLVSVDCCDSPFLHLIRFFQRDNPELNDILLAGNPMYEGLTDEEVRVEVCAITIEPQS